MLRKRTWMLGLISMVLLALTMGAHNEGHTTFSCSGSGSGSCVGDLCD